MLLRSRAHRDPKGRTAEVRRLPQEVLDPPALGEVERLLPVAHERERGRAHARLGDVVDAQSRAAVGARGRIPEHATEDPVQLPRRDPAPAAFRGVNGGRQNAPDSLARLRGDAEHFGVGGERETLADRGLEPLRGLGAEALREVPLVRDDDESLPLLVRERGDGCVLRVGPSKASSTRSATSHSSTRLRAWTTERTSGPCSVFALRRMPAVSTRRKRFPPASRETSVASRVVPATSETIARSSPVSALTSEDFPTLGRPMIASAISRASRGASACVASGGASAAFGSAGTRLAIPRLKKSMLTKDVDALQPHIRAFVERAVTFTTCPDCKGDAAQRGLRGRRRSRGTNIADACAMQIYDLVEVGSRPEASRPSRRSWKTLRRDA